MLANKLSCYQLGFCLAGYVAILTMAGCTANENPKGATKTDPKATIETAKKAETVKFVIIANGLEDKALADGRLTELAFDRQKEFDGPNPTEFTITKFQSPDRIEFETPADAPGGLKAGLFYNYQTLIVTDGRPGAGVCDVLLDKSVAAERKFKLTKVKELGVVMLSGSGNRVEVNEAAHRVFSAEVDSSWTGEIQNRASRAPEK